MQWSTGHGKFGQVDEVLDVCWQEFDAFLHDCQHLSRHPDEKHDHWWIAPFILHTHATHRTIADIDYMAAWIGFDVDHQNLSINDLRVRLQGRWAAYTTASSVVGNTRWRIIVALTRTYTTAEYTRIWQWYSQSLPLDRQTKNPNRIFYLPADWDNADNLWWSQDGRPSDVDSILTMVPEQPVIPPPSAPSGAATRRLPGSDIVTHHMLSAAQQAPTGGRLFRLMCRAAKRCRLEGWALDAAELAQAAMQANAQFAPGKTRPNLHREAQRAIDWANTHCTPQTPIERMRNRILWERMGRKSK